jgi:hypothetical protein
MFKRNTPMVKLLLAFLIVSPLVVFAQGNVGNSEFKSIEFNSSTQIVEKSLPPLLEVSDIKFSDANQNDRLDANESCNVTFKISNVGKGMAKNVKINVSNNTPDISGVMWDKSKQIALIPAGGIENVTISFTGNIDLLSGKLKMGFTFNETSGFAPDAFDLDIETKEFAKPNVSIVDQRVISESGSVQKKKPVTLTTLIQNIGQGKAENVKVSFILPDNVFPSSDLNYSFVSLNANEQQQINFEFLINDRYISSTVPVKILISEKHGKFAQGKTYDVAIDSKANREIINIVSKANDNIIGITQGSLTSDVDKDIPVNSFKNPNRYALIIGNEHYSEKVVNSQIKNVMFANVDATIFKEYCEKTLGVPTENIQLILDADNTKMNREITLICEKIKRKNGQGEIIFYYSGHGSPDEKSNTPFLVPVGLEVADISLGLNVSSIYKSFGSVNAKRTTVFLDACFTGLSETSKFINPTSPPIPNDGKIVIFAATGMSQAAEPYTEKKHGMFTYFLLRKLKESKGLVNYSDLSEYLTSEVGITSLNVNRKAQDPQIGFSRDLIDNWKSWMIYEKP